MFILIMDPLDSGKLIQPFSANLKVAVAVIDAQGNELFLSATKSP